MDINAQLIIPNLEETDQYKALKIMGDLLVKQGYVQSSYIDDVIAREKQFPTGIWFGKYGAALPHGSSEDVIKPAICFARSVKGILFKTMEDPTSFVEAHMICLIAPKDPDAHIQELSHLIQALGSESASKKFQDASDVSTLMTILREAIQS